MASSILLDMLPPGPAAIPSIYIIYISSFIHHPLLTLTADGSFPRMLEAEWQRPANGDQRRMICNKWHPDLSIYEPLYLAHAMYNTISSPRLSTPTCTSRSSHFHAFMQSSRDQPISVNSAGAAPSLHPTAHQPLRTPHPTSAHHVSSTLPSLAGIGVSPACDTLIANKHHLAPTPQPNDRARN